MLRYAIQYHNKENYALASSHSVRIQTRNHTATSRLEIRNGSILLIQEFREGEYYKASALAIGIIGKNAKPRYFNELTVRLSAEPGPGRFTVLIASSILYYFPLNTTRPRNGTGLLGDRC